MRVFSEDFLWGSASAAYQVEGAYDTDGRGQSIWDALSEGKIKHNETGKVACDHYHLYKEDISLMKEIGLKTYRFSISWPRIMPKEGEINQKGIEFYKNLVSSLTDAGIEPMCTLYHWDLPMWIHEKGGWRYTEISELFAEYTKIMVEALSDKVTYWMTINEPAAFIGNGYITGQHAPFENNLDKVQEIPDIIGPLTKNVLLAHGKAVKMIRTYAKGKSQIGAALNGHLIIPSSEAQSDVDRAKEETFAVETMFSGLDYWAGPMINGNIHPLLKKVITEDDLNIICQPLDFLGYNCYNSDNYNEYTGHNPNVTPGMPRTAMGWPITPKALYWASVFFYERYELPILITENGMANYDFVMRDGEVHDPQRIDYMESYLAGLKRAVEEGIPVVGYLYWSLLDNLEWAEGYDKRFGLIYVDYTTQQRTLKDSAKWYAKVIQSNGEKVGEGL